jgi:TPR repeat protein
MKKLVLATILAMSTQWVLANTASPTIDPQFAKVEELVKANNFKAAYEILNQLASQGNAQAIYNLGYLTQTGQGTAKDEKKAIQLYEQAARKGYPVANYVLGKNYAGGTLGLKQDIGKAKQYMEKASAAHFDEASVDLAVLLFAEGKPASDQQALKKLQPLISKGNMQAIHAKALYDISTGFKTKNEKPVQEGLNSIQALAQKGYVPALMAIANMFANGNIVPQNLPEAQKIFAALARENIPQAKESLAVVNKMLAEQKKVAAKKS